METPVLVYSVFANARRLSWNKITQIYFSNVSWCVQYTNFKSETRVYYDVWLQCWMLTQVGGVPTDTREFPASFADAVSYRNILESFMSSTLNFLPLLQGHWFWLWLAMWPHPLSFICRMGHQAGRGENIQDIFSLQTASTDFWYYPFPQHPASPLFCIQHVQHCRFKHTVLLSIWLHSETDFMWWRRCLYPVSSTMWNQCSGGGLSACTDAVHEYKTEIWYVVLMSQKSRSGLCELLYSVSSTKLVTAAVLLLVIPFPSLCLP